MFSPPSLSCVRTVSEFVVVPQARCRIRPSSEQGAYLVLSSVFPFRNPSVDMLN